MKSNISQASSLFINATINAKKLSSQIHIEASIHSVHWSNQPVFDYIFLFLFVQKNAESNLNVLFHPS